MAIATTFRNRIADIRTVTAAELRANPLNWRRHPAKQAESLRGVLSEVGIAAPLIAYHSPEANGALTLIDGHMRLTTGGEWPCAILDVDDAEARLLLATFDPISALAETDAAALDALLRDVATGDAAVQQMLAELAERAGLYQDAPSVVDAEAQIDRAEELRQKWGVQSGDLWALGEHRLICGDCTDAAVVARVLDGNVPALMVTDPPYGVNYDANWRNEAAEKGLIAYAASRVRKVENDDRVDWSDAYRLFPGDVAYTWSPGGDPVILTGSALQAAGFQIRNQIIWRKTHFVISRGHYSYQHEPCWYGVKKGRTAHWVGDNSASTIWEIPLDKNVDGGHSTQKPLECMARPIRNHEGDVYEPFSGSGTTIIAAENLKRRCFAVEIDAGYVAVALERWHTATGKTPERIESAVLEIA